MCGDASPTQELAGTVLQRHQAAAVCWNLHLAPSAQSFFGSLLAPTLRTLTAPTQG